MKIKQILLPCLAMKEVTFRSVVSIAVSVMIVAFSFAPQSTEAACYVRCSCYDRHGNSGGENQGPFQSTAACRAAVMSMSSRCTSASPGLMVSCTPCTNCEPIRPNPPKPNSPKPSSQQGTGSEELQVQRNKEDEQRKAQIAEQKRVEAAAAETARQVQFNRKKSELLRNLKTTRQQLNCVAGQGGDFTNATNCQPVTPAVPSASSPEIVNDDAIPSDPVALTQFLSTLSSRIGTYRATLAETDSEIAVHEQEVERESKDQPDVKDKPAGESDTLRKAREALARAKADREKTASELQKLEQQEQLAKAKLSKTTQ